MKKIHRSEWASLILFLAIFLGTFMRFNPTLLAGFPINDGGMFAVMIDDLKASHYLLPTFTTYNHLNIPYAYPPLGFYLGRIAADLFGLSAVQVARWLPAFFASLAIPAFYWLALQLLKNKYHAAVSTLFFALMPRELSWFVMGAGLTRAPGQFFALLMFASILRLNEKRRLVDVLLAGLFGGLAVLSHPEAAVHAVVSGVFLWLMTLRKPRTFVHAIGVGFIAFIVTLPWWGTVVHYHGFDPFLNAVQTGQKVQAIFHLLFFVFTEEPYATVIAVLGLIGIAQCFLSRNYLLPLWLVIPFLVEGRSASVPAAIPLAMLAAVGLVDVIFVAFRSSAGKAEDAVEQKDSSGAEQAEYLPSVERNVLVYVMLFLVFSTYQFGLQLSDNSLSTQDQEALAWVKENTPENSRFLVLTGTNAVSFDAVLEWFPALTDRQSIYTVQGTEWIKGESFGEYVLSTYSVQSCLSLGDIPCLDMAVDRSQYDYIYISKPLRTSRNAPQEPFPYFMQSIDADSGFDEIYQTEAVVIFEKR